MLGELRLKHRRGVSLDLQLLPPQTMGPVS